MLNSKYLNTMSLKIASTSTLAQYEDLFDVLGSSRNPTVVVREYDEEKHKVAVEKLERLCEIGQRGKPSLVTDLMGDPICRIRHFQLHVMLVSVTIYL